MNETEELVEKALDEQLEDSSNTTYADGEVYEPVESNDPEPFEQTEGDVVPDEDPKEEWTEDAQQNQAQIDADIPEQEGSGEYAAVRALWANGWGY